MTIHCDLDEHRERLSNEQRQYMRKLTNWDELPNDGKVLLERGASQILDLDTTGLTPRQSADSILQWIESLKG